jgi:hypothetical protein
MTRFTTRPSLRGRGPRLVVEQLETREVPAVIAVVPPGTGLNGDTTESYLSDNGRYVVYTTAGTNVTGQTDANNATDVYLLDRVTGTNTLVSRSAGAATTTANGGSFNPRVSADGRFVVFESDATNLVTGQTDANADTDVFLFDRTTGTNTLVSRSTASATTTGTDFSGEAVISADGQFIAFTSFATNIGGITDGNGAANSDVFLYNVASGAITLVSRSAAGATTSGNGLAERPSISDDGNIVAYESGSTNAVTGQTDTNNNLDVFVFNRTAGTTTLASRSAASATTTGDDFSFNPQVSGDGTAVVFISNAGNLVTGQTDVAGTGDVFVYDVGTGATTLVSRTSAVATTAANGESSYDRSSAGVRQRVISDDGNVIVYTSAATNLVGGGTDANAANDVFAFNRATGVTTLISRATTAAGTTANGASSNGTVSGDGTTVAFQSDATNLITGGTDTNAQPDVFVTDLAPNQTGGPTVRLVSSATTGATTTGNGQSFFPQISDDGTVVTFISTATNIVAGATAGGQQTFVATGSVVSPPSVTLIGSGLGGSSVQLIGPNGQPVGTQPANPFPGFTGGIRTAVGDVTGDGVVDLIFGRGPGGTSEVVIVNGATQAVVARFLAFESSFTGGVYVTAGDINLDGRAEVLVTPDVTGGPRVSIYDGARLSAGDTTAGVINFFGIDDPNFRGGARTAVGDMNGDAIPEVAVAAGFLGGPRVTIYDGRTVLTNTRTVLANFFVFESTFRNGAFIAIGDVNGDGLGDLVAGAGPGGGPRVRILNGQILLQSPLRDQAAGIDISNFFTSDPNFRGGVTLTTRNLDGDNLADVVTGSGLGDIGRVVGITGRAILAGSPPARAFDITPFGPAFTGGVYVG